MFLHLEAGDGERDSIPSVQHVSAALIEDTLCTVCYTGDAAAL